MNHKHKEGSPVPVYTRAGLLTKTLNDNIITKKNKKRPHM